MFKHTPVMGMIKYNELEIISQWGGRPALWPLILSGFFKMIVQRGLLGNEGKVWDKLQKWRNQAACEGELSCDILGNDRNPGPSTTTLRHCWRVLFATLGGSRCLCLTKRGIGIGQKAMLVCHSWAKCRQPKMVQT